PYGQAGVDLSRFINLNVNPPRVDIRQLVTGGNSLSKIIGQLGQPRVPESEITDTHKNIAFAVQEACERAMISIVRLALQKTGSRNLCLAGGVALNSKANGKIAASRLVEKFFVQPAASDDGVALGAAIAPYLDSNGKLPSKPMRHGYWG